MDLTEQSKANEFLLDQLLRQAEREGDSYSQLELHALRWPLCGHTIEEDDALEEERENAVPAHGTSSSLHLKVAGHLQRAIANERRDDPGVLSQYESAYATLRGSPFLLASLTSRDARILSIMRSCHLDGAYDLMSMFITIAIPRYRYAVAAPPALLVVIGLCLAVVFAMIAIVGGVIVWKI